RLTQMKWNGTVSQVGQTTIAATLSAAKAAQTSSRLLCRNPAITGMGNGLDRSLRAQLLAQAADADVDDVGAGVEVVAPDLGQEPLAADHLTGVENELVQQLELAVREVGH